MMHNKFRPIADASTTIHKPDHVREQGGRPPTSGVRLWCSENPVLGKFGQWFLQIRAQIQTALNEPGKRFGISTARMSRQDLQWLRDQIDAELQRTAEEEQVLAVHARRVMDLFTRTSGRKENE
jgi:hypothetical protein